MVEKKHRLAAPDVLLATLPAKEAHSRDPSHPESDQWASSIYRIKLPYKNIHGFAVVPLVLNSNLSLYNAGSKSR